MSTPEPARRSGRVLGWISGLGLLVVPWIAAGVLSTAVTMVGPASWDAESTFPWLLLAAFAAGAGWLIYGSARIPGFRDGAIPGATLAVGAIAAIYLVTLALGA